MAKHIEIDPGTVFGRLTVIKYIGKDRHWRHFYNCLCRCGKYTIVRSDSLRSHDIESCGCLKNEKSQARLLIHGLKYHPLFITWNSMMQRCLNPKSKSAKNYFDRGIQICQALKDPAFFCNFLPPKPSRKYSLDRIDNNGNYSCSKCPECITKGWPMNLRWATFKEQANNRRSLTLTTN